MKEPPSAIRRWVTASTSTPTPMSTGSWASWVIQLAVIAFRSSPAFDPTRAGALGIFQVTVLISSSVRGMPFRLRRGARYSDRSLVAWPSGLGKGLQSPVRGFDSRRHLQWSMSARCATNLCRRIALSHVTPSRRWSDVRLRLVSGRFSGAHGSLFCSIRGASAGESGRVGAEGEHALCRFSPFLTGPSDADPRRSALRRRGTR